MNSEKGAVRTTVFALASIVVLVLGGSAYAVMKRGVVMPPESAAEAAPTHTEIAESTSSKKIIGSIDQTTLTTTLKQPTLTGSAIGDATFGLDITNEDGEKMYSGPLTIRNNRWSVRIPQSLQEGIYSVHISATPPGSDATQNVAVTSGTLTVLAPLPTKTLSGDFTYSASDSLPARFYPGGEQSASFIAFPDSLDTAQAFGIDLSKAAGPGCHWVVPASIVISGRHSVTIDSTKTDVANLVDITSTNTPQLACSST